MGASLAIQTTLYYKTTTCITCGCHIALESKYYDERVVDRKDYYCPNGHSQHFIGETDADKLRRELAEKSRLLTAERERVSQLNMKLTKADRATARLKKRVGAGVCPCCQRTFKQLAAHMNHKHPNYAEPIV